MLKERDHSAFEDDGCDGGSEPPSSAAALWAGAAPQSKSELLLNLEQKAHF